ncbi:hypothetical protein [Isachenkonia alkalipeptolytica]|nr:hypothetical protein [Isachenkonia alkalipeptolytica]
MIYLTGDTHGRFERIKRFLEEQQTTKDDMMIISGGSIHDRSEYGG